MTVSIKINTNERQVKKELSLFKKKHAPQAMANAINNVGHKVVKAEIAQLTKKLDRPTPFTTKSVVMPKKFQAKPNDLAALVFVKDIAAKYLRYVYEGGIENANKTSMLVPVTSAGGERLNKFGNIIGKRNNKADAPSKIYYANNALWKNVGKGKSKLLAVSKPFIKHKKFLDFFKIGKSVVDSTYKKELDKEIKKALRK
jgi:hypothetical protein